MSDTVRTYTWNGKTLPIGSPHLSDVDVAIRVRMLMRDQLNHEIVCTDARDRIMCLVAEKAALREALAAIERGDDSRDGMQGDIARAALQKDRASADMCEDCPPSDYPTQKTRCADCPRRAAGPS